MPSSAFYVPATDFDLGRCVTSGQVFRWTCVEGTWVGADGNFTYSVDPEEGGYRVQGDETAFRRLFRLDWDAEAVRREILAKGPELAPYWEQTRGLRLMRPSDPVETIFSFLCTANNHIARITPMVRRLAAYGPVMGEYKGIPLHRFPTLERLAEVTEEELRGYGFGYRAATLPPMARAFVQRGGDAYVASLKQMSYPELHSELLGFKGVGRKLADCMALFGLDHTEAVPIDTHIWQAAVRLYFPHWENTALTERKYEEVGSFFRMRFDVHAGWAQQCLFYENLTNWRSRK